MQAHAAIKNDFYRYNVCPAVHGYIFKMGLTRLSPPPAFNAPFDICGVLLISQTLCFLMPVLLSPNFVRSRLSGDAKMGHLAQHN